MANNNIKKNYIQIRESIPDDVRIVVAAKTQSAQNIKEVIEAGAKIIGENYVQEAQSVISKLGNLAKRVNWHMIGHLQTNKVKTAVKIFDMIETVDSLKLAVEIDRRCREINKIMSILIEINSGWERQKTGIFPEDCLNFIKSIYKLSNIKIMGLMTMGPRFGEPENSRKYFKETKKIFESLNRFNLSNVNMKYLSMGMSNTYRIAIEEGSNMVRPGSVIFGKRDYE